jgi:hypothetical protein
MGASDGAAAVQQKSTVEEIRRELLQLPYYSVFDYSVFDYSVFDYIAFSYDKGTVTFAGYPYARRLKSDAERAVKRAGRGSR